MERNDYGNSTVPPLDGEDYPQEQSSNISGLEALRSDSQWEAEKQLYCRLVQFVGVVVILWVWILTAEVEHDNILAMMGVFVFVSGMLYLLVSTCWAASHVYGWHSRRQEQRLVENSILCHRDLQDENDIEANISSERLLSWTFAETPLRIRQTCASSSASTMVQPPSSGTYRLVCAAVYAGRSIRSESQLNFSFNQIDGDENGWELKGYNPKSQQYMAQLSATVTNTTMDIEGYINRQGEMYWKHSNAIYRGTLQVSEHTTRLSDGDFRTGAQSTTSTEDRSIQPVTGRIILLELVDASLPSKSKGPSSQGDVELQVLRR